MERIIYITEELVASAAEHFSVEHIRIQPNLHSLCVAMDITGSKMVMRESQTTRNQQIVVMYVYKKIYNVVLMSIQEDNVNTVVISDALQKVMAIETYFKNNIKHIKIISASC